MTIWLVNRKSEDDNNIFTNNTSIDEMVDYFISQGKDYSLGYSETSLAFLRAEKGKYALIMTFAEAVKKYNKTREKCFNTTDNVYFRLETNDGKKIINLSGTGVSKPETYEDALKIYVDLKNNQYQGNPIEVLIDDDINTKNATQHTFAVIIDDKLETSTFYEPKDWSENTFVKFMNGGKSGLAELVKGYGDYLLGSTYNFRKSMDKKFEMGYPVYLFGDGGALIADGKVNVVKFRG
jgi:hypothetical protein